MISDPPTQTLPPRPASDLQAGFLANEQEEIPVLGVGALRSDFVVKDGNLAGPGTLCVERLQLGVIRQAGFEPSLCETHQQTAPNGDLVRHLKQQNKCNCHLKSSQKPLYSLDKLAQLQSSLSGSWRITVKREVATHHRSCPLHLNFEQNCSANSCLELTGRLLSGVISASCSLTRRAGMLFISPQLQCARTVASDHAAFRLLHWRADCNFDNASEFHTLLQHKLSTLRGLFQSGQASPYDVDRNGRTLLHVSG